MNSDWNSTYQDTTPTKLDSYLSLSISLWQLSVTFHTSPLYISPERLPHSRLRLLRTFQQMHSRLGLRLVHYSPDGCVAKSEDPSGRYITNFDVAWFKPEKQQEETEDAIV